MAFRNYVIGEVAEEYAQGLLSRREALRRLGLLGLGLTGATALLAACGGGDDDEAAADGGAGETSGGAPSAQATGGAGASEGPDAGELVTFDGNGTQLMAAFKAPKGEPKGALLVMHENKGLTPHFFDLVGRFAKEGYAALCVDLVSRAGGTAKFSDPAEATAELTKASDEQVVGDLRAGIDELARRVPKVKIGAVGFCFGGGTTWKLLDAGEARIAAAVPFYGPLPDGADFTKAKAAVLAIYAGKDTRVNATRPAAEDALTAAGLQYQVKVYEGADHAFFNDTGPRYDADAARAANADMLAWFDMHLA